MTACVDTPTVNPYACAKHNKVIYALITQSSVENCLVDHRIMAICD